MKRNAPAANPAGQLLSVEWSSTIGTLARCASRWNRTRVRSSESWLAFFSRFTDSRSCSAPSAAWAVARRRRPSPWRGRQAVWRAFGHQSQSNPLIIFDQFERDSPHRPDGYRREAGVLRAGGRDTEGSENLGVVYPARGLPGSAGSLYAPHPHALPESVPLGPLDHCRRNGSNRKAGPESA